MTCERTATRGVTLVEAAVGAVVLTVLLYSLASTVLTSRDASQSTARISDIGESLRAMLHRLSEELRTSGRRGEDLNENGTLDAGEDVNGNGRLDADWSVSTGSLTFNRFLPDGTWSLPITYHLNGNDLERVTMLDPSGQSTTVVVERNVTAFTVTDDPPRVVVAMQASRTGPGGAPFVQQDAIRVIPRN
jgi:Tfp pilus assembly protein PilW